MDPVLLAIAFATAVALTLVTLQAYQRASYGRRVVSARMATGATGLEVSSVGVLRARRSANPLFSLLPVSPEAHERATRDLARAGLAMRASEYLTLRLASAAAFGALGLLVITRIGVEAAFPRLAAALAFAFVGWFLPRLFVVRRQRKRLAQIEKQLPDALTAMAKALRAGAGLLQALAFAADETPAPLGPELQSTLRDLQLGAEAEDVFRALTERVGSADLDIAITAIVIQRTVGGNLSEILSNVTHTIRERAKLAGEIRVLTSRQRLTSNLIAILPVLVVVAFLLINRNMGALLITTTVGQITIAASLMLELLGIWLIRRLGVIEI